MKQTTTLVQPQPKPQVKRFARQSVRTALANGATYAALTALSLLSLLPLFWMISTGLRDLPEISAIPPQWLPRQIRWQNFAEAWGMYPFSRYLVNTLGIAAARLLGTLLTTSLVAYAFARYRARGKALVFLLVISPLFLPEQVTLMPLFALYGRLGWLDTYLPLIVPAYFGGLPLFIFLMRQFFMSIPRELDDAARIDGCSEFGIFWRILLPLAKPALATVAVFEFMHTWNDFLMPLIVLNSSDKYTLSLGLARFLGGFIGETPWHLLMAAATLVALPPVLLFFFAQKYFVQGIVTTGLKG